MYVIIGKVGRSSVITMSATIKECLELQLLEMEMLFSMFPNKEDIILNDAKSVPVIRKYVEGIYQSLPPSVGYTVFVRTEDEKVRIFHFTIVSLNPYYFILGSFQVLAT